MLGGERKRGLDLGGEVEGEGDWREKREELGERRVDMERDDIKMLVKKWWDIYSDESLDYKPEDTKVTLLKGALTEPGKALLKLAPSAA